jgi:hypothetical protein
LICLAPAEPSSTLETVRIFVARSVATVCLLATLLWVLLPAVAMTCALPGQAASAASDCPSCCETGMPAGGGVVCGGCQVGVAADSEMPRRPVVARIAWLAPAAPGSVGLDLAPADPPPR